MNNAELIKALRVCADCTDLQYGTGRERCTISLMRNAADALEAAEKRIAELESQIPNCGEWIVTTEVSDDGAVTSHINCSRCGFYWREPKHGKVFKRCPNCGARMRGAE